MTPTCAGDTRMLNRKHLAAIASLPLLLLVLAACGGGAPSTPFPDSWVAYEATARYRDGEQGFSIRLPPGWEARELQGIDSYVGEIAGEGVRLTWDYGLYSNSLAHEDDPAYQVTYETIGGMRAKLVRPAEEGEGHTGVYFEDINGTRLSIAGGNLTRQQEETVFAMFRTIRALS